MTSHTRPPIPSSVYARLSLTTRHVVLTTYEADPPLRPASLAFSLPGSKDPLEAWPPCDAISLCSCISVTRRRKVIQFKTILTYLLVRVHSGKAALAGLASFRSDLGDFFLGTVGEVTGVRVISHDEGCKVESYGCICLREIYWKIGISV